MDRVALFAPCDLCKRYMNVDLAYRCPVCKAQVCKQCEHSHEEKQKPTPGWKWRLLAHRKNGEEVSIQNQGCFDELVVDDWLHIEQMDERHWWMRVGDARIEIRIPPKGSPVVEIDPDDYATMEVKTT